MRPLRRWTPRRRLARAEKASLVGSPRRICPIEAGSRSFAFEKVPDRGAVSIQEVRAYAGSRRGLDPPYAGR
jgi:hypothetical protein